jgi:hypothetical protein
MTIAEIKNKLTSLGISSTEPIIVGSGILDMLGIRPSNDVDLLISKETFYKIAGHGHEILQRPDGSEKIEVDDIELMHDWYGKKVSDAAIKTTVIDGIKFMSIEEVCRWKALLDRSKDQVDILLIDKCLESCGKA